MKFAIVGGLGFLAFVLLGSALGLPFAQHTEEERGVTTTMKVSFHGFETISEGNGYSEERSFTWSQVDDLNKGKCGKAINMSRSALFFGITSSIFAGVAFLAGFFSLKLNPLPIPLGKLGGFLLLIGSLLSMIAWGLAIGMYTAPLCDENTKPLSKQDYKMGPCPPLMIVSWLFMIGGGIAGVVMPDTARQSSDLQQNLQSDV